MSILCYDSDAKYYLGIVAIHAKLTYFITISNIFCIDDNIIITLISTIKATTVNKNEQKNAAYTFCCIQLLAPPVIEDATAEPSRMVLFTPPETDDHVPATVLNRPPETDDAWPAAVLN